MKGSLKDSQVARLVADDQAVKRSLGRNATPPPTLPSFSTPIPLNSLLRERDSPCRCNRLGLSSILLLRESIASCRTALHQLPPTPVVLCSCLRVGILPLPPLAIPLFFFFWPL